MRIRAATREDAATLAALIRCANAPVAVRVGLSAQKTPKHPSNCTADWIMTDMDRGVVYFLALRAGDAVGCVGFEAAADRVCYMERLAVIPARQCGGIGSALVDFFMDHAREQGMSAVGIGIIAENGALRGWYEHRGFTLTGTRVFDHLPFTVAFLRRPVE